MSALGRDPKPILKKEGWYGEGEETNERRGIEFSNPDDATNLLCIWQRMRSVAVVAALTTPKRVMVLSDRAQVTSSGVAVLSDGPSTYFHTAGPVFRDDTTATSAVCKVDRNKLHPQYKLYRVGSWTCVLVHWGWSPSPHLYPQPNNYCCFLAAEVCVSRKLSLHSCLPRQLCLVPMGLNF